MIPCVIGMIVVVQVWLSGVTTPGQLWAMPRLPFGLPRLLCPQIDKTFYVYVTLMLLVSWPGCPFTLVKPLVWLSILLRMIGRWAWLVHRILHAYEFSPLFGIFYVLAYLY